MPNAFDHFALTGSDPAVAASISVDSMNAYSSFVAGEDIVIGFKYNPGRKPTATELGFGLYNSSAARAAVSENLIAGTAEANWDFGTQASGATVPSLVMSPSSANMDTTFGDHAGTLHGTMPEGVTDRTQYYGLVAIRQADLETV